MIDQVASHFTALKILEVSKMKELTKEAHLSIIRLTTAIIESQEGSGMEVLCLSILSLPSNELTDEEKQLIDALVNSQQITLLKRLYFFSNSQWFSHEEAAGYLFDFIKSQTRLEELGLSHNKFSGDVTEELLAWLANSDVTSTIKRVFLKSSACFDTDSSVALLAAFVSKAQALKGCYIDG